MHKKVLIVKTILDNMTHNKATVISMDQFLMHLCTLLENINQRSHAILTGLLIRCLWSYVTLLRHMRVDKRVRQIFVCAC